MRPAVAPVGSSDKIWLHVEIDPNLVALAVGPLGRPLTVVIGWGLPDAGSAGGARRCGILREAGAAPEGQRGRGKNPENLSTCTPMPTR
jgi:hypothetical protein